VTDADDRPALELADPKELLLGFLDFYRSVIARKVDGLTEAQLRSSRLPSGWTPLELLNHLVHIEARWVRWGFAAEQLPDPWGDQDESGRWRVGPEDTAAELLAAMDAGGARTRAIAADAELADVAAAGGRFADGDRRPTLAWVLFHVLQEYARHAGHLDIARELLDGATGE
jgi:uncharacterized damage-inducible protein DinB